MEEEHQKRKGKGSQKESTTNIISASVKIGLFFQAQDHIKQDKILKINGIILSWQVNEYGKISNYMHFLMSKLINI